MMIRTVRYADMELESPVAIVGFPSSGLVSSIAANYYVSQLKMKVVAGISGSDLPPYCFIYEGSAYPPIRIYGHKAKEKRGKKGKDVVVCLSEYAPKPDQCYEVAHEIMDYLRSIGTEEIVCLEGVPRMSQDDKMSACGSGPSAAEMIKKGRLPRMESGMVRGTTGVMLYDGPLAGFSVISIMVPGNQSRPDPGSAAEVMGPMSKIVPGLKVGTSMLLKEAEEINKRLTAPEQPVDDSPFYG